MFLKEETKFPESEGDCVASHPWSTVRLHTGIVLSDAIGVTARQVSTQQQTFTHMTTGPTVFIRMCELRFYLTQKTFKWKLSDSCWWNVSPWYSDLETTSTKVIWTEKGFWKFVDFYSISIHPEQSITEIGFFPLLLTLSTAPKRKVLSHEKQLLFL